MLKDGRQEDAGAGSGADIAAAIAEEGLRYVSDRSPGYSRARRKAGFVYYDTGGKRIVNLQILRRIKAIGVPPAYESVWICPSPNGHLQATGVDARGRKQYRYHVRWRELRDQNKYSHVLAFAEALPALRARVASDMGKPGMPREKVIATIVSLLEKTLIRVGNAEYASQNQSYGLTTMRRRHVSIARGGLLFQFVGKSGKTWKLQVHDKRVVAVVKRCAEIPGHDLFKYLDEEGMPHTVDSSDVNGYIKDATGQDFSAKDFRTWAGTVLAAMALREFAIYDSHAQAKRNVVAAIEKVSRALGNTPTICRKCYIHPEVLTAYLSGDLAATIDEEIDSELKTRFAELNPDELLVMAFLHKRLQGMRTSA